MRVGTALLIGAGAAGALYVVLLLAALVIGRRATVRRVLRSLPDCVVALRRMTADPRISPRVKLVVLGLLAYLALPIDLVPDFIPIAGQLDDAILIVVVLWYLRRSGRMDLLRRHWPGASPAPG